MIFGAWTLINDRLMSVGPSDGWLLLLANRLGGGIKFKGGGGVFVAVHEIIPRVMESAYIAKTISSIAESVETMKLCVNML